MNSIIVVIALCWHYLNCTNSYYWGYAYPLVDFCDRRIDAIAIESQ
ncbi:MAG: hypothetical protein V7K83_12615 [Nostoc sp.]